MEFSAEVTADLMQASLHFENFTIETNAEQLGALIAQLASIRGDMHPAVGTKLPAHVKAIRDAQVEVLPGPEDTVVVAVRHPGFGWTAYSLARSNAKTHLADALEQLLGNRLH